MTMQLAHPALTTLGKRKGKQKFRNAEEARKARELAAEWEAKQAKWNKEYGKPIKLKKTTNKLIIPKIPEGRGTRHLSSIDSGHTGAVTIKQTQQYTGDKIIGIGTMHKSNAVPIFNDEAAKDISKMRR
jgi:hypothetical protein